jgi:hypothetical protein
MATPPRRPFGRNRPGACRTPSSTARRPSASGHRRCSALRPCWPSRPRSRRRGCGNRRPVRREVRLKLTCCRDRREHAPLNGLKGFLDDLDRKAGGVLPRLFCPTTQPGPPDSPSFDNARAVAARLLVVAVAEAHQDAGARRAASVTFIHDRAAASSPIRRDSSARAFPRCCAAADN